MGFGIALIGYAFLIMADIGGSLPAAICLAYGFFLASRLDKRFLYASAASLGMLPRGVVILLDVIKVFDLESIALLDFITFALYMAAWMMMTMFWLAGVVAIAAENKAEKFQSQAIRRMYMSSLFAVFSLGLTAVTSFGITFDYIAQVNVARYVLTYVIVIVNTLFMHKCFVLITSERQYEADKRYVAAEDAKAAEKKYKDTLREAEHEQRKANRKR